MKNLKLSEIWIYPIKSLGGIRLSSAKVMEKGLQFDRRFMLVDNDGKFMTQRVFPAMALFKLSIQDTTLTVRHQQQSINIPVAPAINSPAITVQVWDDAVQAHEVSPSYSQWFSERLGISCRLMFFPEEYERPVDPQYKVNDEHVSFADAYPFLIIGQASLDDLNRRLKEPVPMNRFRPNLVFTGGEPYEEDTWREFTVGQNTFVGVKPCARCVLTTVNQDTAEKGTEPLKTLASYRNRNNKIYLGQNLVAINHTSIQVGDTLSVLSTVANHMITTP
ncbi:MAG TPA: MOSC N-terminal beta barrel domain-containing protein [Ohtaekwangia sp.]|uniref:MOSC domain-containing protein n=1 Tax=Ohtaekwangia sp. TaxID=2066019 RepID=UPI002F952747